MHSAIFKAMEPLFDLIKFSIQRKKWSIPRKYYFCDQFGQKLLYVETTLFSWTSRYAYMTIYSDNSKKRKMFSIQKDAPNMQNYGCYSISDENNSPIGKIERHRKQGFLSREFEWTVTDNKGTIFVLAEIRKPKKLFQRVLTFILSAGSRKIGEIVCHAGLTLFSTEYNPLTGNEAFIDLTMDGSSSIDNRIIACAGLILLSSI